MGTIGKFIELLREERKHVEASSLGKILDDARKLREVARYAVYSEALQDKVPEMLTKAEKFISDLERIEGA